MPPFGIVFSYLWEKNFFSVSVESLMILQHAFAGCSFREFFTSVCFLLSSCPGIFFFVSSLFCENFFSFSKSVCLLILLVNASIALAILSRVISRRAVLLWLVSLIFLWI